MSKITVMLVNGAGSTYVGDVLCKKDVATEVDAEAFAKLKPVVKSWFHAGAKKPPAPKSTEKKVDKKKSDKKPAASETGEGK